jgi:glycosyltransferase involved in cell wall biosynthesis
MGALDLQPSASTDALVSRMRVLALNPPFVTVVVTVYNYASYVAECLRSIAGQTYRHFKCIVVDDCSTDQSVAVIEEFIARQDQDGRFTLLRHDLNRGQMAAFKTGIAHADGEFLVYVDADDLLLPEFLSGHLQVHLEGLPVAFTSADQYQINERGELIAGQHPDLLACGRLRSVQPHHVFGNVWVWATTSSMMFRRAVLELILPEVTEPFRRCADNYICHFANMIGGSLLVPQVLGCYRRHGVNYFSQNRIVGGRHPTGDMRAHPAHRDVRETIVGHLLGRSDDFIKLLGHWPYLRLLTRSMTFAEAVRLTLGRGEHHGLAQGSRALLFLSCSFARRLRWALRLVIPAGLLIAPVRATR